jgi:hypothetical protein
MLLLLAPEKSITPYAIWIGVMIGALVVAAVVLLIFRSRVLSKDSGTVSSGMLDELRAMLNRGDLTQEEFDAAKAAMVAKLAPRPASVPAAVLKPKAKPVATTDARVAPPGFDLTGRPLPKPRDEGPAR